MLNNDYQSAPHPEQMRYHSQEDLAPVMRFADWLVIMLIMMIPVLNGILLITWAMDKNSNPNRRNWALASLFFVALQTLVFFFIIGAFMGTIMHAFSGLESIKTW